MDKQSVRQKIQKLSKEIEDHNYRYYALSEPIIADKEYDDKLKQLIILEEKYPEFKKDTSPSQRVGTKISSGERTVTHKSKMYSLDNTYSVEELKDWHKRVLKGLQKKKVEYVVELKIDGISAALEYVDGIFQKGATRGDGITGEDVTNNLRTIRSLPLSLLKSKGVPVPKMLDVRGEVFMNRGDFEFLNQERKKHDEVLFANARNAASGSIKLLDSRITAKRQLSCFIHSFGVMESEEKISTHWDFLEKSKLWGFPVCQENRLCSTLKDVVGMYEAMLKKRESLPFEVDGVVIKVNRFADQRKLGETLKSPRWAVAYKFPAYQATTMIREIVIQVGRTGILTPVAELEPVQCAGVTISRSTLHNFDEIKRLGIHPGDRVLIERAGDVIPKIIKVIEAKGKKTKTFPVPRRCPVCKGPVTKEKTDEVAYRCTNPVCSKKLEREIVHFASRGAMDIEGLGESVVKQLLGNKLVENYVDLYYLKREGLLELDLFSDKKADNLLKAIDKSKKQPLSRLIFGLGIAHVGQKAALVLAKKFGSMDVLTKAEMSQILGIQEIGETIAVSVQEYFTQRETKNIVERLRKANVNLKEPRSFGTSGKLADRKFVFTGELKTVTRVKAMDLVVVLGGEIISGVSKNVDFVVAGKSPGSKYKKAIELGIKILNEKQFREMVNA